MEEVAATGLPAVVDWVLSASEAESVAGVGVEALSGGAVSARVERLDAYSRASARSIASSADDASIA